MDLSQEYPRNEAWESIGNPNVAAFGITLQGASHKQRTPPVACQDAHAMHWMEDEGTVEVRREFCAKKYYHGQTK